MNERQIISFILIIAVVSLIASAAAYVYFVGNPLQRFFPQSTQEESTEKLPTPTPIPVFPELLRKSADAVGTIEAIDGNTLTIQTQIGKSPYLVDETIPIYQILTEEMTDPPKTSPLELSQLTPGDQISIYLNEDQTIQAIFVVKTTGM